MGTTAEQLPHVRDFPGKWVQVTLSGSNDDKWMVRKSSVDVVGVERTGVRWERGVATEFRARTFIKVRGVNGPTFVTESPEWLAQQLGMS